jgi:hypothetical protein
MDRDDIIRLAREAGFDQTGFASFMEFTARIERFAALVAAAEREACVYRANIALLGADRGLANRVNQAIRNRT